MAVVIDPEADVFLICGEDTADRPGTQIQVSSAILSRGSSVFKAILSAKFKEGHELATRGQLKLHLPDDSGNDMTTVCNVLHMRTNRVKQDITPDELLEISVLVDKYDCCEAMAPTAECWIKRVMEKPFTTDEVRCKLLVASYVFKIATLFRKLGSDWLFYSACEEDAHADSIPECATRMRDVFSALGAHRRDIKQSANAWIESYLEKQNDRSLYSRNCAHSCTYVEVRFSWLLRALKDRSLWPSSRMADKSLKMILDAMCHFTLPSSKEAVRCAGLAGSACKGWDMDTDQKVSDNFRQQGLIALTKFRRLCLACVDAGEILKETCEHSPSTSK